MLDPTETVQIEDIRLEVTPGALRLTGSVRVATARLAPIEVMANLVGHYYKFDHGDMTGSIETVNIVSDWSLVSSEIAQRDTTASNFISFTARLKQPSHLAGQRVTWELTVYPVVHVDGRQVRGSSVTTWYTSETDEPSWRGFFRDEAVASKRIVPGVTLHQLAGTLPTGPVRIQLVDIDLTYPDIQLDALLASGVYLNDEAQWSRQPVSELVRESGAVVGINANFFEMNATHNPRGMHISNGRLLKSHNARWHSAVYFGCDGKPYFGKLHWTGGIRDAGTTRIRPLAGLNITTAGPDGITLFRSPWRRSPGQQVEIDDTKVVELVVEKITESTSGPGDVLPSIWGKPRWIRGIVKEVRVGRAGVAVTDSCLVVSGKGEGARYLLETFDTGGQVEVCHAVGGESYWPGLSDWRAIRTCVCGNVMLLRNGQYCDDAIFTDDRIHPRTCVATTHDQSHLLFIVVDGRSEESIGMTYRQVADFLLYMGAFHAINLDGGGSSTLAIREGGIDPVAVVNVPSEGAERPVPDGLAVFYQATGG